ncbi:hypothetical protein GQ42DRAFT_160294 [Ramicandelaber brevisporus]|nr:hypothetical protein GQ42DRAFT_161310 [Ramicandelaber brevisporus]KAI8873822.1 hypothetical protein GQ42DRAFT_160294 [Ramicandelaber brevisporus]
MCWLVCGYMRWPDNACQCNAVKQYSATVYDPTDIWQSSPYARMENGQRYQQYGTNTGSGYTREMYNVHRGY